MCSGLHTRYGFRNFMYWLAMGLRTHLLTFTVMRTTMIPMHEVAVKFQYDGERENMLSKLLGAQKINSTELWHTLFFDPAIPLVGDKLQTEKQKDIKRRFIKMNIEVFIKCWNYKEEKKLERPTSHGPSMAQWLQVERGTELYQWWSWLAWARVLDALMFTNLDMSHSFSRPQAPPSIKWE